MGIALASTTFRVAAVMCFGHAVIEHYQNTTALAHLSTLTAVRINGMRFQKLRGCEVLCGVVGGWVGVRDAGT
jgi:hypothetical protein